LSFYNFFQTTTKYTCGPQQIYEDQFGPTSLESCAGLV